MNKTTFKISKMDCGAEEQMIRIKLQPFDNIHLLKFDLLNNSLEIFHTKDYVNILSELNSLRLDTKVIESIIIEDTLINEDTLHEQRLLLIVFFINFSFFLIESVSGWLAHSMGLVADSLDMLADAIIFGISLFIVGKAMRKKKIVAQISGYFQFILAIFGMIEITRRFLHHAEVPDYKTMIIVSSVALIANAVSLYIIQKSKAYKEVHIQAGKIFLSNDVIINIGVIVAGILVLLSSSKLPDLIIGTIVFILVSIGAYRILKL